MGSRRRRSKTRSPSSEPPPEPVFFVDRDLGRRFPAILAEAGVQVQIHDNLYPEEEKPADDVWLEMVAQQGWIGVSHDANIRHTSRSRDAIVAGNARLIVVKGHARTSELAENFVRTLPAIRRFVTHYPAPWIAKLYRDATDSSAPGRINLWWGPE